VVGEVHVCRLHLSRLEETEVQEEAAGAVPHLDQAILQAHRQLKDTMEGLDTQTAEGEAEVLLKLVRMEMK
jgi:hypothetical protein